MGSVTPSPLRPLSPDPVDLRRQFEVSTRQSIDVVRPCRHSGSAPAEADVRVVVLLLGESTDLIREGERGCEILEGECPFQMMFVHDSPFRTELFCKLVELLSLEFHFDLLSHVAKRLLDEAG